MVDTMIRTCFSRFETTSGRVSLRRREEQLRPIHLIRQINRHVDIDIEVSLCLSDDLERRADAQYSAHPSAVCSNSKTTNIPREIKPRNTDLEQSLST